MKYDIGLYAKNWPSILGAPNSMSSGRVITYIFQFKTYTTKSARPLGVKGLGPILAFWPITSEDFEPLTQRNWPGL
jgi:hypothetical protein